VSPSSTYRENAGTPKAAGGRHTASRGDGPFSIHRAGAKPTGRTRTDAAQHHGHCRPITPSYEAPDLIQIRVEPRAAERYTEFEMPARACSAGFFLSSAITFFASRSNARRYAAVKQPSLRVQFGNTKPGSRRFSAEHR